MQETRLLFIIAKKKLNLSMKKIAVITPVYNGEKFIKDCFQSVALSVVNGFTVEHIVVDDGSTDNSWEIIQKTRLPSLKTFRLDQNKGGSFARNFAVKNTQADYLFCLDADDVLFQNSLNHLFRFATKTQADWVYGDFLRANENLSYLPGQDYYGSYFSTPAEVLISMFCGEHFFQGNCFFLRKTLLEVGAFDESIRIAEDLDLFIRFALNGNVPVYLPGPLYLHRLHKNNTSRVLGRENNINEHKKDLAKLYQKYKQRLKNALGAKGIAKIEKTLLF